MTKAITRLAKATQAANSRAQLIRDARAEGETWEAIAAAAQMSRAGAIKLGSKPPIETQPTTTNRIDT
jgi:hypothetical protein